MKTTTTRNFLKGFAFFALAAVGAVFYFSSEEAVTTNDNQQVVQKDLSKKSLGEKGDGEDKIMTRARFVEERLQHEFNMQVNPETGVIPMDIKERESMTAYLDAQEVNSFRIPGIAYATRGPSNLGGRTRSLVIDAADGTGQTIIAGGVSSGVFRTTNGGTSWTKVSNNNEIHNVTTIAQDPTNTNIWYYGTGESLGNSASLGSFFLGQGIWQSTNGGVTWAQLPSTNSSFPDFNSFFDLVQKIVIHPTTGDIFAGTGGGLLRFDQGTSTWITERIDGGNISTGRLTDVVITPTGRVYASFSQAFGSGLPGVWTSANGEGGWTQIATNGTPTAWAQSGTGRVVLEAPEANSDIIYALYDNSGSSGAGQIEADLWRYTLSTDTWSDLSSKLPDETGGSTGNDPFAIQGGYDLVIDTKPDNANYVVIGGTNAYRITNVITRPTFERIGGYGSTSGYPLWGQQGGQGGDNHHPDVHAFAFDPTNSSIMYSGTDGGVHRTDDLEAATVQWVNINNEYQTYQYYHVGIDPQSGSDGVIGGAQDNGTTAGGTTFGLANTTVMNSVLGGDGAASEISRDDACVPFFSSVQFGRTFRDCPGGFTEITPAGSTSQFVTYFHLDPDNNNALYYAGTNRLYRTTNSTAVTTAVNPSNWRNMGTFSQNIASMATTRGTYNAASSNLFIGGTGGAIFRLADPQNTASTTSADNITPPGAGAGVVAGLAVHPTNGDILMAAYANYGIINIWLTTNATAATPTWTNVERNLADFSARSVAITESGGQTLYYVGTARGLYASTDPATTDWTIQAPSQIGLAVISSLRYRAVDSTLLIGTHGNGMFEADVPSVLSSQEFLERNQVVAYPNPTTTDIRLTSAGDIQLEDARYTIINVSGQTVKSGQFDQDASIFVGDLSSGIYFLRMRNADNREFTTKFVKR